MPSGTRARLSSRSPSGGGSTGFPKVVASGSEIALQPNQMVTICTYTVDSADETLEAGLSIFLNGGTIEAPASESPNISFYNESGAAQPLPNFMLLPDNSIGSSTPLGSTNNTGSPLDWPFDPIIFRAGAGTVVTVAVSTDDNIVSGDTASGYIERKA